MKPLVGTLFAILTFHAAGTLFLTYFWRKSPVIHRAILALPVGFGIWATTWIGVALTLTQFTLDMTNSTSTLVATFVFISILISLSFAVIRNISDYGIAEFQVFIIAAIILLFLSTGLYFRVQVTWMWDSFRLFNWAQGVSESLRDGFPLINLANANLSTLISVDYYLYIIHPLFALSLTVFIFAALALPLDLPILKYSNTIKITIAVCLVIIFSINWFFLNQAFFINHHVFTAVGFIILLVLIMERESPDLHVMILFGVISLFMTLARMEGFLFVMLSVAIYAFYLREHQQRLRLIGIVIVFNLPYVGYLIFASIGDWSFVSTKQHAIVLFGSFLFFLAVWFRLTDRLEFFFNKKMIGPLVTAVLLLSFIIFSVLRPDDMLESLNTFARASMNVYTWGGSTLFIAVVMPSLWLFRILNKQLFFHHDAAFYVFLSSILLILNLTYFRGAYRQVLWDSGQRMMFHFLPLAYYWVGLEILRLSALAIPNHTKK